MNMLPSQQKRHVKNKRKVNRALEDLQRNHNHSWYHEIMLRNKKNMCGTAIFYRGTEISYSQMDKYSFEVAKSLKNMNIDIGSEIIICMPNMPELIYVMLAASRIGAILNFVSAEFESDCLKKTVYKDSLKFFLLVITILKHSLET